MGRSASPEARRSRREGEERDRSRGRDYEDRSRSSRGRDRSDRERDRDGKDRVRDADKVRFRDRDDSRGRRRDEGRDNADKMQPRMRDESRGREREANRDEETNRGRNEAKTDENRSEKWREMDAVKLLKPKTEALVDDNLQVDERAQTVVSEEKTKDESMMLMEAAEAALEAKEQAKEMASFEYTGSLAVETNKANGVALQFTEPPEARKPTVRWRLYVFKDGEPLDEPLYIHRQSCYLFGRERKIADIPIDHPSCSKQHAVIQYRLIEKDVDGLVTKKIKPYLMDLGSTNKTFLNGEALDPQRYYELFEKDTIKFGNSSREYVLLHENSA